MRSGSSSYSNATLRGALLVAGEHPVDGPVDLRVLRRVVVPEPVAFPADDRRHVELNVSM